MSHQFGIVLSGGGIRGAAHIGILKAFELAGIRPTIISGASSGSVVGAMYAAGYRPEDIFDIFKKAPFLSIRNYAFRKAGIFDSDYYMKFLAPIFPENSFEALQDELYICATDLMNVDSVYFHSGSLIDKIIASCAYPFFFSPVEIDGIVYADGGIINNFPLEPMEGKCKVTIGVYCNPLKRINKEDLSSSYRVMERSFLINVIKTAKPKFAKCDYMIIPEGIERYNIFNKKSLDDCYRIGYQYGLAYAEEIEKNEMSVN